MHHRPFRGAIPGGPGMRGWAHRNRLDHDVGGHCPGGGNVVADAYRRLARAQKGHARGAPAYSVYVNRRLGRVLAAIAYRFGLTPNQVSILSAVHSFLAIVLIAVVPATIPIGVVIALLLVLGYAWDSADGQVARLRGGGTPQGEWLDHFIDTLKISSLHLAVLVGLYHSLPDAAMAALAIPLVFSVCSAAAFSGMLLNDLLKGKYAVASTHERGGGTWSRSLILLPTDFGLVCLVFVLWGWPTAFIVVYGLLAAVSLAFLVMAAVKWYRDIGELGR